MGCTHPFERVHALVFAHEAPPRQTPRGLADEDLAGRRQRLQARGQVGRIAERQVLAVAASADIAHHHEAGVDAHAQTQAAHVRHIRHASHARHVQLGHGLHQRQAAVHGTDGGVFLGQRVAEIHQQAIAQVLGHHAAMALQDVHGGLLVGQHDGTPGLWRKRLAQRRGIDQVGEEDGQLAALPIGLRHRLRTPRQGLQHALAVAQRQADLGQVGFAERTQHIDVDGVSAQQRFEVRHTSVQQPLVQRRGAHVGAKPSAQVQTESGSSVAPCASKRCMTVGSSASSTAACARDQAYTASTSCEPSVR